MTDAKAVWRDKADQVNREFAADCDRISKLSVKEKVDKELSVRIFPAAFMERGWIRQDVNSVYDSVKQVLTEFFTANSRYPRCPARFWFPLIRKFVDPRTAKFYEVVAKNDGEIYYWAKARKIAVNESFQKQIPQ